MRSDNYTPFLFGFLAGVFFFVLLLMVSGNWPGDSYQKGVRDCATGRANIKVLTDTIVVTP